MTRLTTTFHTNNDGQVWMDGWRESKNGTARFSIRHGDVFLDNLDWPTAYKVLAPKLYGRGTPVEYWLKVVLPKV